MEDTIFNKYTDKPICPYCGEAIEDWHDLDVKSGNEVEVECGSCEKEFSFIGEIDWKFNSYKKD